MSAVNILGSIGSILSIVANLPQLWRVRHSNTTKDLDIRTTFISMCSGGVWSGYGFLNALLLLGFESAFVGCIHFLILCAIIRDKYYCERGSEPIKRTPVGTK